MTEPTTPGKVAVRTETEVRELVRGIVLELAPSPPESAELDARLGEDLGYQSLALTELAFTLEDAFDLAPIDEPTARKITTLGAVIDHVVAELAGRGELAAG